MSMFRNFVLTAFVADVSAIQDGWTDAIDNRNENKYGGMSSFRTEKEILKENLETYEIAKEHAVEALQKYKRDGSYASYIPDLQYFANKAELLWQDQELIQEVLDLSEKKKVRDDRIKKEQEHAAEQRRVVDVSVEKGEVRDTQYYNVAVTRNDGKKMEFKVRYNQVRAAYDDAKAIRKLDTAISRKRIFHSSSNQAVVAQRKENFELVIPEICGYIQESRNPYFVGWNVVAHRLNAGLFAFLTKN